MKKYLSTFVLLLFIQSAISQKAESPYEWDWTGDGIWTGLGLAGSTGGLILIKNKEDLTIE